MTLKYVRTTAKLDRLQGLAWMVCANIDLLNGTFITIFKVDIDMQHLLKVGYNSLQQYFHYI